MVRTATRWDASFLSRRLAGGPSRPDRLCGRLEQDCSNLPYGDQLDCSQSIQSPTEHHFTGKERDTESGNDYFGARYYASSMGRFLSPDPLNLTEGRIMNPSNTLNKYAYASNNPFKYIDPDGEDVTYFYDPGGVAGHAVLFAYNQQTGDSALESFGPDVHAPEATGVSNFDMDLFHSAQGLRDNYASLTIQTTPELAQQVIDYIRANPDPSTWKALGPNCSTQCDKILQKFKLDYQKALLRRNLTPKFLMHNLMLRYNPAQAGATPQQGTDYGAPRFDMYELLWTQIDEGQRATVTTQQQPGLADPCTATPKPDGCS
jgi:RHS repeat-associated protein